MPCPTPMHIVATHRPFTRFSSRAAVSTSRAPLMPSGWPSAIAPPFGFTFSLSSGKSNDRVTASACAAKASFNSSRSISAMDKPKRDSSFRDRENGADAHHNRAPRPPLRCPQRAPPA